MNVRQTVWLLAGALVFTILVAPTAPAQDVRPQTAPAPPAATTAKAPNPLGSPARMVQFFSTAVAENRAQDAQRCLNFKRIDPEVVRQQGDEYVAQLAEILTRMQAEKLFDPEQLSDTPDADSQAIGRDPLILVLQRYKCAPERPVETQPATTTEEPGEAAPPPERCWQFAEATVADIPTIHANLDELIGEVRQRAAAPQVETPVADEHPLRSPYHTVQHFLAFAANAKEDSDAYREAMRCMDLSLVEAEDFDTKSKYVDDLYAILTYLRDKAELNTEELPQAPTTDSYPIGRDPFQLILVCASDGAWRFRARTVAGIPGMIASFKAAAQAEATAPGAAPVELTPVEIRRDTSSPQATMNLFLSAMRAQDLATAVTCFDLSQASDADRGIANVLAGKLWLILKRRPPVALHTIDSDPDATHPYPVLRDEAGQIWIGKHRGAPRDGEWLFTPASFLAIDRLYDAYESKPLVPWPQDARLSFRVLPSLYVREYLVPAGMKLRLAGLQAWQWIGLAALLVLGLVVRWLCNLVLPPLGRRLLQTDTAMVLPHVVRKAMQPTATLLMLIAWWAGLQFLDLGATIMGGTWWFLKIAMSLAGIYAFYRLIDVVMSYFAARAARTSSRLDDVLVPLLQKTLKVVVVAFGLVFLLNLVFGVQIGPLFAGLGVGGLAIAFAAQDTIRNFFGAVNVVLDRPFQVGDWVQMGDVEGTVESVGLRSSRIRTFYNSQITVPNSEIMTARIDNLGRRQFRRTKCMISVLYSTPPEKLEAFCEGIRELVRRHPYTRKDYYHTWVNEFSASSIDILLCCFHECPDWGTELRERHRLFLDIVRLAQRLGVEFAFPTQTVHLHHESSPPATPPPSTPAVPADGEEAIKFGAAEAAKLVRESFGDEVTPPPPVKY